MVSIATHNALLKNEDVVTKILILNFNTWYKLNVKTKGILSDVQICILSNLDIREY